MTSLPATLQVSFTNGADPTMMKALLDGVDISSQFSAADSNGVRQAQVDRPALNMGTNQLEVVDGTLMAQASFTVILSAPGAPGGGAALPLLIPIQTRYLTGDGSHNSDYNIALFEDPNNPNTPTVLIPAPNATGQQPSNQGLQVVFLRRSDLALISNVLVPNEVPSGDGNAGTSLLNQTLIYPPPAGCGSVGCLLIMQSLKTLGYTPCSVPQYSADCGTLTTAFEGVGASAKFLYANGAVTDGAVAYSFIGNKSGGFSNLQPGAYFERLTCSGTNSPASPRFCDTLPNPGISSTAPSNATPSQIGNMSGALVRDNYLNYTYVQNAPMVAFSSAIDNTNQGQNFPSHAFTINGQTYWSGFPTTAPFGGFHVVILDRTTLALKQNQWWAAQSDASELNAIASFLSTYNTDGNLIFFAAFGDTTYTSVINGTNNRVTWANFAGNTIPVLGGTPQVFYLVNNQEHIGQIGLRMDDYTLVGGFAENSVTGLAGQNMPAEMSSVIARETEAYPQSSLIEGFLQMDHQGYYNPSSTTHRFGIATDAVADAINASRLTPTPWPFPGPDTAKSQAAYTWISQRLCCDDIRAAYINQNVLPLLWLDELSQLSFDANSLPNSDQQDFDAMKGQLTTEFQYLASVRQLQANIQQIYQSQQSNVALELQQAQDQITNSAQVTLTTPTPSASWIGIMQDAFKLTGLVAGFVPVPGVGSAIGTAMSLATIATQIAGEETTKSDGTALQAEEAIETTPGGIAAKAADEYARTLVQLGNQYDRVATDWGRLKTLGGGAPCQSTALGRECVGVVAAELRSCYFARVLRTASPGRSASELLSLHQ